MLDMIVNSQLVVYCSDLRLRYFLLSSSLYLEADSNKSNCSKSKLIEIDALERLFVSEFNLLAIPIRSLSFELLLSALITLSDSKVGYPGTKLYFLWLI